MDWSGATLTMLIPFGNARKFSTKYNSLISKSMGKWTVLKVYGSSKVDDPSKMDGPLKADGHLTKSGGSEQKFDGLLTESGWS